MTFDAFKASLAGPNPLPSLGAPLEALWWVGKDDWDKAHKIVMADDGADAAWVHAYLHRVEGDLPNAQYWYRRSGRAAATGAFSDEWSAICRALLA